MEVAAFLKSIYQPATQPGKRATELLWDTATLLTDHPMDDTLPRYKAWETETSLFVTMDVIDNHTGIRHAALEGHTAEATRELLVLVTCAIHHLAYTAEETESTLDPTTLENLVESFSFSETRKKSLAAKCCTVLYDRVNDKTMLVKIGGIILPLERHFRPTVDDTARTALPRELMLALIHYKKFFFKGGLALQVTSSIPISREYVFQAVLLTLLSVEHTVKVPTPSERPRH